jgi:hypothetical protein
MAQPNISATMMSAPIASTTTLHLLLFLVGMNAFPLSQGHAKSKPVSI